MDQFFFDKTNNLVSISNAILKHFTGECFHTPHKELMELLDSKPYQKVVIMLFDGLGKSLRELHLDKSDYLRRKKAFDITSVFPPTTAAATTALVSGRYGLETGWLGWQQYFENHNLVVEMFTNCNAETRKLIKGPTLSNVYCNYESITDLISKKGIRSCKLQTKSIQPDCGASSLDEFFEIADVLMKKDGPHFYYMYWPDPDGLAHKEGINSINVKRNIKEINRKVYKLAKDNKDNLIIVLADHSLVDTKWFNIKEHDDFYSTLKTIHSLDSRSSFFHLKEGKEKEFLEAFNKYYKDYFILLSKEEVLSKGYFGKGEEHPKFKDFLGDYMATSISEYGFTCSDNYPLIGAHSGSLKEESIIEVSILNK